MIKSSYEGKSLILVLNESVILPERNSFLSFNIVDQSYSVNFILKIIFSDEKKEEKYAANMKIQDDGKQVDLILYSWDPDYGVHSIENKKLASVELQNGKNIFFKFKTSSDKDLNYRTFQLSVWKEDIK